MRAATTEDPNYFPNDDIEENSKEEAGDASLVGNELVIEGVVVDKENVFDHDQDENIVLEDVINQRDKDIQEQRAGARKSQQKQADKLEADMLEGRHARSYKTPV